jgi:hypothetical protein
VYRVWSGQFSSSKHKRLLSILTFTYSGEASNAETYIQWH